MTSTAGEADLLYRVVFAGVYPNFTPSGDPRSRLERQYGARWQAQSVFDEEPSAIQMDRWEPQASAWITLAVRVRP